jgi:phage/plasmid-like protein (TIGR03299 family)
MSDYFDTGMLVGQPAWHGLGVVVTEAPSLQEAIRLASIGWTVESIQVQTVEGFMVPRTWALVRSDTRAPLGLVSDRYNAVQNSDMVMFFQPLVEKGLLKIETLGSLKGGQWVWALAKLGTEIEAVNGAEKDKIAPYVLISNNHGQGKKIQVKGTPTRVVCWNTLSMALADKSKSSWSISHKGDTEGQLKETQIALETMIGQYHSSMEAYRKLKARQMTDKQIRAYFMEVLQVSQDAQDFQASMGNGSKVLSESESLMADLLNGHKYAIGELQTIGAELANGEGAKQEKARTLAQLDVAYRTSPGSELAMGSAWGAYNAVTYYTDHVRGRKDRDTALQQNWFGAGSTLRDRAFELALN